MDKTEILKLVDHTELNPAATWADIQRLCDEGVRYGVASVCIPPCYVKRTVGYLDGKLPVCTVIGFPHGNSPSAAKVAEAKWVTAAGAKEIDMVINQGYVKDGHFEAVTDEIRLVKQAVGDNILKVIIETCRLTDEEIDRLCTCVTDAGADFIKTSTGFADGGATVEAVARMAAGVAGKAQVKAAGGIRTFEAAEAMLAAGAHRIGASALVRLAMKEE